MCRRYNSTQNIVAINYNIIVIITVITMVIFGANFSHPREVHDVFEIGNSWENQDGGVGRHTAPPRTTRTDRKSNGKGVQHQGNTK